MTPTTGPRIVQIPVKYFFSKQFDSLNQLRAQLEGLKCNKDWFLVSSIQADQLHLVKVCDGQNLLSFVISEELEWTLQISNCSILSSATILQYLPSNLSCLQDLRAIINFIDGCKICKGNGDPNFAPLVAKS